MPYCPRSPEGAMDLLKIIYPPYTPVEGYRHHIFHPPPLLSTTKCLTSRLTPFCLIVAVPKFEIQSLASPNSIPHHLFPCFQTLCQKNEQEKADKTVTLVLSRCNKIHLYVLLNTGNNFLNGSSSKTGTIVMMFMKP